MRSIEKNIKELLGHDPLAMKQLQDSMQQAESSMKKLITIYDSRSSEIEKRIEAKLVELGSVSNDVEKAEAINNDLHELMVGVMLEAFEESEKQKRVKALLGSFILGVASSLMATWFWSFSNAESSPIVEPPPAQQIAPADTINGAAEL